jgi:hypothetical protein
MKKIVAGLFAVALAAASVSAVFAEEAAAPAVAKPEVKTPAAPMPAMCYSCDKCHRVAMAAGKCALCGEEMTGKHMLGVKGGNALLCTCGAACPKCHTLSDKAGKCECGMDMKVVE